jgi:hypothetical protein
MNDDRMIVDMIERASDAQPICACGRHTTAVWRDGIVWLECATLLEPRDGRLGRLLAAVTAPVHTHVQIVEVPAAAA